MSFEMDADEVGEAVEEAAPVVASVFAQRLAAASKGRSAKLVSAPARPHAQAQSRPSRPPLARQVQRAPAPLAPTPVASAPVAPRALIPPPPARPRVAITAPTTVAAQRTRNGPAADAGSAHFGPDVDEPTPAAREARMWTWVKILASFGAIMLGLAGLHFDKDKLPALMYGKFSFDSLEVLPILLPFIGVLAVVALVAHRRGGQAEAVVAEETWRREAMHRARFGGPATPIADAVRERGVSLSAWYDKRRSFLRAVIAFVTTYALFIALSQGVSPGSGFWHTLQMNVAGFVFAVVFVGPLLPHILQLAETYERLGLPRGWLDVAVAATIGSTLLLVGLFASLTRGALPDATFVVFGLMNTFCGAIAGFEFWRSEGAPGASKRTAALLDRFKSGLLRGLRMSS